MKYDPEKNIAELRALILKYDVAYYINNESLVEDAVYDAAFAQLRNLEQDHPNLVTKYSPTQRVAGSPISSFASITHKKKMYSLDNAFNIEGIIAFDKRVKNSLPPGYRLSKARAFICGCHVVSCNIIRCVRCSCFTAFWFRQYTSEL